MVINKDVMAVNVIKLLYFCIRSRIAFYVCCDGSFRDVGTCLTKFTAPHNAETV